MRRTGLCLLLWTVACSAPRGPGLIPSETTVAGLSVTDAAPPFDAGAEDARADAPSAAAQGTDAAVDAAMVASAPKPFDVRQWLKDRGLEKGTLPSRAEYCVPESAGVPLRDALACLVSYAAPGTNDSELFDEIVLVVDGAALRQVWRGGPVGTGPMAVEWMSPPNDREGRLRDQFSVLLEAGVAPDGTRLVLREHQGIECAPAMKRIAEARAAGLGRVVEGAAARTRAICATVGRTYPWSNGRYLPSK